MKITDDMLTGWFPPEVKPVRPGIYLVKKFPNMDWLYWRYWDGAIWKTGIDSSCAAPDMRIASRYSTAKIQDVQWRGLNKEPQRD